MLSLGISDSSNVMRRFTFSVWVCFNFRSSSIEAVRI